MAIKNIYSLHFPMATNSFPLPCKLISIILILSVISSSKNIKQYNYIFFSEIYILKYPSPLFLLNTLFVNWKLSFLYWELNSSVTLTLIFCECLKLIMVLLGTVHVHHGKLSARICCNLHHIMSLIGRWHTETLTH